MDKVLERSRRRKLLIAIYFEIIEVHDIGLEEMSEFRTKEIW